MGEVQCTKTKVINFTHSKGDLAVGNPKGI